MAQVNTDGTLIRPGGNSTETPYTIFANNMTSMLKDAQNISAQGNTALQGQIGGLERGQAALGRPGEDNPLNFLYNMSSASGLAGNQSQMSKIFEPGITSIEGQQKLANQNLTNIQGTMETALKAYDVTKPVWTLSPTPNENGEFYFYNTNVAPGQNPQVYPAGKIPPQAAGSPGGSPGSADSVKTLAEGFNPYGIKMSDTTAKLFAELGATPGGQAVDGGNFWSFPDETSGEKAARALLTSNIYANDTIDQALRQWSNYTGTGQYPGYNAEILKGTGIDPNMLIKNASGPVIDTIMSAMKKAENVGNPTTPADNSVLGKIAQQVASGVITYDTGVSQVNNAFGNAGGNMVPKLTDAILKLNPSFKAPVSNATGEGLGKNTETATLVKPQIDMANAIIDGTGTQVGILSLFDKLPSMVQSGSYPLDVMGRGIATNTVHGLDAIQAYDRALADLRAKVNAVISTGVSLGVVKAGETADDLFPVRMTRKGLEDGLKQVKAYEKSILDSLTGGTSNTSGTTGTNNIETLRAKYNY